MINTNTASYKNIEKSLETESLALLKYLIYADIAREEGHEEIAVLFEKMAQNEREHAKIWYKLLHDGCGNTEENLKSAASGENYEWKNTYPDYAQQARKEGFDTIAVLFERIASIESDHERRFFEAYDRLINHEKPIIGADAAPAVTEYYCLFCGQSADSLLPVCPTCNARDSFTD